MKKKDERIKIGVVGVDSGQLVVTDPCYIIHDGEQKELNDYAHMMRLRSMTKRGKLRDDKLSLQLNYDKGHEGLGVVFNTGYGDGVYEVWATIGNTDEMGKRVKKVEIILID